MSVQPNALDKQYAELCAVLGDLVFKRRQVDSAIREIEQKIEKLNELAGALKAAESKASEAPKSEAAN